MWAISEGLTEGKCQELIDKCTWTWTTQNGKNGCKVVSNVNGNSIFLPAAGSRYVASFGNAGGVGSYWSSSLNESSSSIARSICFGSGNPRMSNYDFRSEGNSVRPVLR